MAAVEPVPLVAIVGETASGKSALALKVATLFNGEIICVDSRTIYKGMDIGTAKPSTEERRIIPHHLLDIVNPDERFNVADFKMRALEAVEVITNKGKLPILVGGTGLYIDAVLFNFQFGEAADPAQRAKLELLSINELQSLLREKGYAIPENSSNKRYLIRALERHGETGEHSELRANTLVIGLRVDRQVLKLSLIHI